MEEIQIKKDIDNINIDIETPHDESNSSLHSLERDNWGKILNNKTFKVMKDNFINIKSSLNNLLTNIVSEFIKLNNKDTEIENNVNLIKKDVEDFKIKGSKLNEETINKLADKTKENTFKEINIFEKGINSKLINLDNNKLAEIQTDTINLGDVNKNINIIGKGNKLFYNGKEIEGGVSSNGGSGGNNKEYILVKTLPDKVLKFNSDNKPFFEKELFSTEVTSYYSQFQQNFIINKDTKPFTNFSTNTDNIVIDTIKVSLSNSGEYSDNNYSWYIQSNSLSKKFQSIFNVKSHTEKIYIPNLVGISFKFNISIEVVNKNEPESRYNVIETISNKNYYEEYEMVTKNKYGYVYLTDFTLRDIFNSPVGRKGIENISEFSLSKNNITSGGTVIIVTFDKETSNKLKNYYNDNTKKFYIKLNFKEFKLIKYIENSSGGTSTSGGTSDFSGAYGVPVIAHTFSSTYLPVMELNKRSMDNIVEYGENKIDDLFNGNLPLEVDNVNIMNNRNTKPIVFKHYDTQTNKNIIIPAYHTNFNNKGTLLDIFKDNKDNIPIDKIFGVSFRLNLNIVRINNDRTSKTIINENKDIEIRFKRGFSTNLEGLFSSANDNMDYYVNGVKENEVYTGWFKIASIDLDNNINSTEDDMYIYLKLKKTGFYNLVSIKNYLNNNSIENIKCYESIRIENARPFFEDLNNLSNFRFDCYVSDTKILLRI